MDVKTKSKNQKYYPQNNTNQRNLQQIKQTNKNIRSKSTQTRTGNPQRRKSNNGNSQNSSNYIQGHSSVLMKNEILKRKFSPQNGKKGVPVINPFSRKMSVDVKTMYYAETTHSGSHVVGTEFLEEVIVQTTHFAQPTDEGMLLTEIILSPLALQGTRFQLLAQLYQRFNVKHITVHYVPVVSSVQNGSLIGFCSYDPDLQLATVPADVEMCRVMLSMENSRMFNVYQGMSFSFTHQLDTSYWTRIAGSDARLSVPGNFYLIAASTYLPPLSTEIDTITLGNLWLSYDVEFYNMGLLDSIPKNPGVIYDFGGTMDTKLYYPGTGYSISGPPFEFLDAAIFAPFDTPGTVLVCKARGTLWTSEFSGSPFPISVRTPKGNNITFSKGQSFYLMKVTGDRWRMYCSLSGAISESIEMIWTPGSNFTTTGTLVGSMAMEPYQLL